MTDSFKLKDMSSRGIIDLLEKNIWGKEKSIFTNVNLFDFVETKDIEEINKCIEDIENYKEEEVCLLSVIRNDLFDMLKSYPEYIDYEEEYDEEEYEYLSFGQIIDEFLDSLNIGCYNRKLEDLEFKDLVNSIYNDKHMEEKYDYLKENYLKIIKKNQIGEENITNGFEELAKFYIDALLSEKPRENLNKLIDKLD